MAKRAWKRLKECGARLPHVNRYGRRARCVSMLYPCASPHRHRDSTHSPCASRRGRHPSRRGRARRGHDARTPEPVPRVRSGASGASHRDQPPGMWPRLLSPGIRPVHRRILCSLTWGLTCRRPPSPAHAPRSSKKRIGQPSQPPQPLKHPLGEQYGDLFVAGSSHLQSTTGDDPVHSTPHRVLWQSIEESSCAAAQRVSWQAPWSSRWGC